MDDDKKATPSSRDRVLLMPELLELILLHLPPAVLLVTAQRVSRTWKSVMDSSLSIQQQALFLRPLLQKSTSSGTTATTLVLNPLLQKAFPPWFQRTPKPACRGPQLVDALPWAGDSRCRAAFMRSEASWRRMLPCQPARRVLEVAGKESSARGFYETNGVVEFGDGEIRMGPLYDFGIQVVRRYVGSFWIQWWWDEEEEGTREREGEGEDEGNQQQQQSPALQDKLTIFTHWSWFKSTNMPPQVGSPFLSEAHENLQLTELREEQRSRQWHSGFANPPVGGWRLLRQAR